MTALLATLRHPQFRAGAREMAAASLGLSAWGLVTGIAMVKSGLSIPLALLMTLVVYAGSAQLASLPLLAAGAPMWVIWATAFCVNLRFVIFSAHWRPFFAHLPRVKRVALGYLSADVSYVVFMKRFSEPSAHQGQIEYYLGGALLNWLAWQLPSVAGIVLAEVIPTAWGIGFAGVLALLGLFFSLLSDTVSRAAAAVAATAAVAAFALPLKLNIVVAIAAAVCLGLLIEGRGDPGRRLQTGAGPLPKMPPDPLPHREPQA